VLFVRSTVPDTPTITAPIFSHGPCLDDQKLVGLTDVSKL
jgi:hypothetical protein